MTLIVNFKCSYFEIFVAEVWKNELLKFTINVYNKKWLICRQKAQAQGWFCVLRWNNFLKIC